MIKKKAVLSGEGPSSVMLHLIPDLGVPEALVLYEAGATTLEKALELLDSRSGDFIGMKTDCEITVDEEMSDRICRALLSHPLTPELLKNDYDGFDEVTVATSAPSLLEDLTALVKRRLPK